MRIRILLIALLLAVSGIGTGTYRALRAQGGHNITLTWSAPATGGAVVTYNVLRGTSSGTETQLATVSAPTTTYVDSTGVGGVKYFYEVSGTNTGGTGPVSNEVSAVFLAAAPGAPQGLAAASN